MNWLFKKKYIDLPISIHPRKLFIRLKASNIFMFDNFRTKEEFFLNENKNEQELILYKQARDRTELKRLSTIFRKQTLENAVPQRKTYMKCLRNCYEIVPLENITVEDRFEMRECKNKCKSLLKDIFSYYDNINFLSEKKLTSCTKKCNKEKYKRAETPISIETAFQECLWVCYNKLDRRYQEYWHRHRERIVARHSLAGAYARD